MIKQAEKFGWRKRDLKLIENPDNSNGTIDTEGTITENNKEILWR